MLTRKAKLLLSLTAATPLLFAACTDNTLTGPDDVAGTYQLTLFAGNPIPPALQFSVDPGEDADLPNGGTVIVNSGTIVLNDDGTFIETNNFTKIPPGGQSFNSNFVSTGTFTVSGTALNLFAPQQNGFSARNLSGTFRLDTITYLEGGFEYEYQR